MDDLVQEGIIEKVEQSRDWTSNIVLVEKDNKLRICIDPSELNQARKRENYEIPTVEEILLEKLKQQLRLRRS